MKLKKDAHEARIKDTSEDDFELTKGTFNEKVVKLALKRIKATNF